MGDLPDGFEFEISLAGADAFAVSEGKTLTLNGNTTHDITLKGVELETVTGKVTGLSAEALMPGGNPDVEVATRTTRMD